MTISSLLRRSNDTAALVFGITGCVLTLTPKALRAWEENLADAAIRVCVEEGGIAVIGQDRVVSCAPSALANKRVP